MNKSRLSGALCAILSTFLAMSVNAALIAFSDRGAFESNLASYTVETFENLADSGGLYNTYSASGLTIGDITYTGHRDSYTYIAVVDPLIEPVTYDRGTGAVIHAPSGGWMTMFLPAGTNAIGADFSTIYRYGASMSIAFSTGDSSTVVPGDPLSFTGFISDTHIDWVRFGNVADDFPLMDNFTFGSTIPLPPALWLFGSGLLGLIGMARRKPA